MRNHGRTADSSRRSLVEATVRRAVWDDVRLIWEWRNDPSTREQSVNEAPVPWETHRTWYQEKLDSPESRIWILLDERGQAAAVARYDRTSPEEALLSFFVGPRFRGRGWGREVVEKTLPLAAQELEVRGVRAQVKEGNTISRALLGQLGFELVNPDVSKESPYVELRKRLS